MSAREIVNSILYVVKNGCTWRALPHDFPNWRTVFIQRVRWHYAGVLDRVMAALRPADHNPSVGIIDSTFVVSSYGGCNGGPSRYKMETGHSLHVVIDKNSRVLGALPLSANLHDSTGARRLLPEVKLRFPSLQVILGDRAYRGLALASDLADLGLRMDSTSPALPTAHTFVPLPLRWRIEQYFSWLMRWRRVARNWCFTALGYWLDVSWSIFGLELNRAKRLREAAT